MNLSRLDTAGMCQHSNTVTLLKNRVTSICPTGTECKEKDAVATLHGHCVFLIWTSQHPIVSSQNLCRWHALSDTVLLSELTSVIAN
eukprot:scaffold259_cov158-Amphora_coffeaeformis.AAC.15